MSEPAPGATAPTRIGLVGYGKGGRVFHAPLIARAHGCELTAVVTRSAERRAQVERDWPAVAAHDSLAAMVASGGVDAVTITTPLDSHVALALEAIELGVPVLVDKPFAPDSEQGLRLIERAESRGVLLTVYQNRRWDADFRTTRAVVASGALGDVVGAEFAMEEQPAPPPFSMAGGGGTSLDFGSHIVDQAICLLGPVHTVYAVRRSLSDGSGLDDRFHAVLTHDTGLTSEVTANWDLHDQGRPRFRVHGSEGTLVVAADDGQSARLLHEVAGVGSAVPGPHGAMASARRPELWRRGVAEPVTPATGAWEELYQQWGAAVRGEGPVPVAPRESLAALRVIEALRRSADTGESVHL